MCDVNYTIPSIIQSAPENIDPNFYTDFVRRTRYILDLQCFNTLVISFCRVVPQGYNNAEDFVILKISNFAREIMKKTEIIPNPKKINKKSTFSRAKRSWATFDFCQNELDSRRWILRLFEEIRIPQFLSWGGGSRVLGSQGCVGPCQSLLREALHGGKVQRDARGKSSTGREDGWRRSTLLAMHNRYLRLPWAEKNKR